jgi:hypothetical protein
LSGPLGPLWQRPVPGCGGRRAGAPTRSDPARLLCGALRLLRLRRRGPPRRTRRRCPAEVTAGFRPAARFLRNPSAPRGSACSGRPRRAEKYGAAYETAVRSYTAALGLSGRACIQPGAPGRLSWSRTAAPGSLAVRVLGGVRAAPGAFGSAEPLARVDGVDQPLGLGVALRRAVCSSGTQKGRPGGRWGARPRHPRSGPRPYQRSAARLPPTGVAAMEEVLNENEGREDKDGSQRCRRAGAEPIGHPPVEPSGAPFGAAMLAELHCLFRRTGYNGNGLCMGRARLLQNARRRPFSSFPRTASVRLRRKSLWPAPRPSGTSSSVPNRRVLRTTALTSSGRRRACRPPA